MTYPAGSDLFADAPLCTPSMWQNYTGRVGYESSDPVNSSLYSMEAGEPNAAGLSRTAWWRFVAPRTDAYVFYNGGLYVDVFSGTALDNLELIARGGTNLRQGQEVYLRCSLADIAGDQDYTLTIYPGTVYTQTPGPYDVVEDWIDGPQVTLRYIVELDENGNRVDNWEHVAGGQVGLGGTFEAYQPGGWVSMYGFCAVWPWGLNGNPDFHGANAVQTAWNFARREPSDTIWWTNGDPVREPAADIEMAVVQEGVGNGLGWGFTYDAWNNGTIFDSSNYVEFSTNLLGQQWRNGEAGPLWFENEGQADPPTEVDGYPIYGAYFQFEPGPIDLIEDPQIVDLAFQQGESATVMPELRIFAHTGSFTRDPDTGEDNFPDAGTQYWMFKTDTDPANILNNANQVEVPIGGGIALSKDWWNGLRDGQYLGLLALPTAILDDTPPRYPIEPTWPYNDVEAANADLTRLEIEFTFQAPRYRLVLPGQALVPNFTWTVDDSGRMVHFDASSSWGAIVDYEWTWDDQVLVPTPPQEISGELVDHQFYSLGPFDVTLTVTDVRGQTATITQAVDLTPSAISGDYLNDRCAFSGAS